MDGDILKEKIVELLKKIPPFYYLSAAIFVAGLIFLVIGLIQFFTPMPKSEDVLGETPKVHPQQLASGVVIDVEGAVMHPGVYSLPGGSRLKDALIAAGGISADANRDLVAQQINMAVKITDGAKIYIPKIGDPSTSAGQGLSGGAPNGQTSGSTTGLININTASAETLDSLPGVGQVTAQKIISGRPYSSIDELLSKKVVSNSVFQKIKEQVSVF